MFEQFSKEIDPGTVSRFLEQACRIHARDRISAFQQKFKGGGIVIVRVSG